MTPKIKMRYQGRRGQFYRPNGWENIWISRPGRHWVEYQSRKIETPALTSAAPPSDKYVYPREWEMLAWCSANFNNRWYISWHYLGMDSYWHFEDTQDCMLFRMTWDGITYE